MFQVVGGSRAQIALVKCLCGEDPRMLPTLLWADSKPHVLFSVTYCWELRNAKTISCQQRSNWLFGHYKTLMSLLGIYKLINGVKK
jgi:hypothetical protein